MDDGLMALAVVVVAALGLLRAVRAEERKLAGVTRRWPTGRGDRR